MCNIGQLILSPNLKNSVLCSFHGHENEMISIQERFSQVFTGHIENKYE